VPVVRYLCPDPDAPSPTLTAVIVPVPVADPLVGEFRDDLDVAASWGVPAHITVLYPFVEPAQLSERVMAALATAVGPLRAFDYRLDRTAWFGGDVLWLAPEPAQPFREFTTAVWRAFPEHPPYEGAHADSVPHLTVAERRRGTLEEMRAAERVVQQRLPFAARAERIVLIAGTRASSSWRIIHEFALR